MSKSGYATLLLPVQSSVRCIDRLKPPSEADLTIQRSNALVWFHSGLEHLETKVGFPILNDGPEFAPSLCGALHSPRRVSVLTNALRLGLIAE